MTSQVNKENQQIEIKKENLEQFAGLYLASTLNRTLDFIISEDSLTIGGSTKLIPTSQKTFRIKGRDGQYQFKNLSNKKTQLTVLTGKKELYTRVEKWTPNKVDLTNFEGDYWSDELETVYHLVVKDEKLSINHRWLGDVTLEPVTQDLFKTDRGYYVKFVLNNTGGISGLSIYSGRTLNVFFQRKK